MPNARTLVSYKLPTRLVRELRRVSREARREMTGIVEDAVRDWLIHNRWLPFDESDTVLDPTERRARTKRLDQVAKLSTRYPERMAGRSHDDVLYGEST
jgi:hypothetical protein